MRLIFQIKYNLKLYFIPLTSVLIQIIFITQAYSNLQQQAQSLMYNEFIRLDIHLEC